MPRFIELTMKDVPKGCDSTLLLTVGQITGVLGISAGGSSVMLKKSIFKKIDPAGLTVKKIMHVDVVEDYADVKSRIQHATEWVKRRQAPQYGAGG